jgi:predicted extracellular nuclease
VGDPAALDDLVQRLGGGWHTELSSAPDSRGIRVGFLSRLPLVDVVQVVDLPAALAGGRIDDEGGVLTRLGRGALQVGVQVGAVRVTLLTCHLKSKLLSFPGGRFSPRNEDERARYGVYALNRRAAEAGAVRIRANQVLAGQGADRAVIVLGDLNDTAEAATTQTLLGPGGSEIGTPGERRPDKGDAWRLWNLAPLIPADHRFSRVYQGRGELIDHILVSRRLLGHVTSVDSLVTGPDGTGLPSVTDQPSSVGSVGSDHAPVVATLDIG